MEVDDPNSNPLSPEELAHLEKLKSAVEKALEDGKFSRQEATQIKSIIWSNGKVTYEELRIVHETIKSVTGNEIPDMEWQSHS